VGLLSNHTPGDKRDGLINTIQRVICSACLVNCIEFIDKDKNIQLGEIIFPILKSGHITPPQLLDILLEVYINISNYSHFKQISGIKCMENLNKYMGGVFNFLNISQYLIDMDKKKEEMKSKELKEMQKAEELDDINIIDLDLITRGKVWRKIIYFSLMMGNWNFISEFLSKQPINIKYEIIKYTDSIIETSSFIQEKLENDILFRECRKKTNNKTIMEYLDQLFKKNREINTSDQICPPASNFNLIFSFPDQRKNMKHTKFIYPQFIYPQFIYPINEDLLYELLEMVKKYLWSYAICETSHSYHLHLRIFPDEIIPKIFNFLINACKESDYSSIITYKLLKDFFTIIHDVVYMNYNIKCPIKIISEKQNVSYSHVYWKHKDMVGKVKCETLADFIRGLNKLMQTMVYHKLVIYKYFELFLNIFNNLKITSISQIRFCSHLGKNNKFMIAKLIYEMKNQ
jgi:hypothetical protein